MAANPAKFAQLLNRGVNQIHACERKPKLVIRDELGYAVGKQGRTALDYWCRDGGHLPDPLVVEKLAREVVSRKGFNPLEAEQFLASTNYPDAHGLMLELFPLSGIKFAASNVLVPSDAATDTAQAIPPLVTPLASEISSPNPHLSAQNNRTGLRLALAQIQSFRNRLRPGSFLLVLGTFIVLLGIGIGAAVYFKLGLSDPTLIPGGFVKLVGETGERVVVSTAQGPIAAGKSVSVNEAVTVRFKILDNDTRAFSLQTLVIGARGPGVHCNDPNPIKWSAPNQPFPTMSNIHMEPGKEYEYSSTRSFYEPGTYILEPNVKDNIGRWGGIQPFTCIDLVVG